MDLIESFRRLDAPEALLLIVGRPYDESLRAQLEQLAQGEQNIRFQMDFIPDERVQVYMKAADVVVLPFQDIFTSGSLLLAMSFGKAIIVPALESVAQLCVGPGFLSYPPDEQDGLCSAMRTALTKNLARLGEVNLEKSRAYDWNHIGAMTHDVYLQSLNV